MILCRKNLVFIIIFFIFGCTNKKEKTLFEEISTNISHIDFQNKILDTDSINILDYLYYYNGGGVATGDVNNDGLVDIYFTSNQNGNKLYLNKGNFVFEDITEKAGVMGFADWTTGVTMADVNADGWLDIYVSTVSNHIPQNNHQDGKMFFPNGENQLFINNKNGTFTNKAKEFGLNIKGYNTQAVFFDYDNDNDLDFFQLQHSIHQTDTYGDTSLRRKYSEVSGCKLFKNDRGIFKNVTKNSGLLSSALGYGLGVAVADYNHDGYDDIYIGNDFHESDYYYINNTRGGFTETNNTAFGHQSNFSMGNDAADVNNDGWTDIVTLDMLPNDEKVLKSSNSDDAFDNYESLRQQGYSYQYSRNCLQLNTDKGNKFTEIGLYSGIAATDWSWSVLANDFDLDGYKDIFITNGIKQRMNDLDYIKFISSDSIKANAQGTRLYDKDILKKQPDGKWHNYAFKGKESLVFTDVSFNWGFNKASLSNGASYADLDNDGDVDLITNNINENASIYKNNANDDRGKKWLSVQMKKNNVDAIGAKCFVFSKGKMQYQQLQPVRGFLSSVEPKLFFGFEDTTIKKVDSIIIVWNNIEYSKILYCTVNKNILINDNEKFTINNYSNFIRNLIGNNVSNNIIELNSAIKIDWKHKENYSFVDFNRQWLIPHEYSTKGPAVAVGDINGDGIEDVFLGGAKTQPSVIFTQTTSGAFKQQIETEIAADSLSEDVDAEFFDADNDGDNDLYVVSGGNEYFGDMKPLADRLYINDGKGNFTKSTTLPNLYENKSCVTKADIDGDGDIDLFVGSQTNAQQYGLIPTSFLLLNDGKANFTIGTSKWNTNLEKIGMVSDAQFEDINKDGFPDLVVCGEWMQPIILINEKSNFAIQKNNFPKGWYQHLNIVDIDGDGFKDILLGNYGSNSKLLASTSHPMEMYINDIDNNGKRDQILSIYKNEDYFPFANKEYLEKQLPYLKKEFLSYTKMAGLTTSEIFRKKIDEKSKLSVDTLGSYWIKNNGGKSFTLKPLEKEMQWTPIFDSYVLKQNLIVVGNFYGVLPYEGRYDANAIFSQQYNGNIFTSKSSSHFNITGESRKIKPITIAGIKYLLVLRNNEMPLFMKIV
jgi:enediyne biosynthesis protein E4